MQTSKTSTNYRSYEIIIYGLFYLAHYHCYDRYQFNLSVIIAKRVREIGIYVSQGFSNRRIALIFKRSYFYYYYRISSRHSICLSHSSASFPALIFLASLPLTYFYQTAPSFLVTASYIRLLYLVSVFVTTLASVLFTIQKAIQIDLQSPLQPRVDK